MRICTWVIFVAQGCILIVLDALLRFLMELRVLRAHAGHVTLCVIHWTVLRLPSWVASLRWLRLHWSACLLVFVNLILILFHLLFLYERRSLLLSILLVCFIANVWICWVFPTVIESILRRLWLLSNKALLCLPVEIIALGRGSCVDR